MNNRQKTLLSLIWLAGGAIGKGRLQKLLFLYCQGREDPEYEFIPGPEGGYSYTAEADMKSLVKKGYLREENSQYNLAGGIDEPIAQGKGDPMLLEEVVREYGEFSERALNREVHRQYPFYVINSALTRELLTEEEREPVRAAIPERTETILFTLGYEGIALERYFQELIQQDVRTLVDVREAPYSRKFGFSKKHLERCGSIANIDYIHLPEVGIPKEKRKKIKTPADRQRLFADYQRTTLRHTRETQAYILSLLARNERIALTCYERDPGECHRSFLAEAVAGLSEGNIPIRHLGSSQP